MGNIYYQQLTEGITIPAIIDNGTYFLIQMGVYENGIISCWQKSDLKQFRADLETGWVVSQMPIDKELSIGDLGAFKICAAHWHYSTEEFYQHVVNVVRSLNPEMANLYHTTQRELEKWEKAHVCWTATPIPCKQEAGFGYNLSDGDSSYIFYRKEGQMQLTLLTLYADKTAQIDAVEGCFYTQEEIEALFKQNILCTFSDNKEWVSVKGLGELKLSPPSYGVLPKEEKEKEIADIFACLSGEKDSLKCCREAHYEYLINPTEQAREELRKAYEKVPEHQRKYLGNMDTKDGDFIRILTHPDRKREV